MQVIRELFLLTGMFLSLVGFYVSLWKLTHWIIQWLNEEDQ